MILGVRPLKRRDVQRRHIGRDAQGIFHSLASQTVPPLDRDQDYRGARMLELDLTMAIAQNLAIDFIVVASDCVEHDDRAWDD